MIRNQHNCNGSADCEDCSRLVCECCANRIEAYGIQSTPDDFNTQLQKMSLPLYNSGDACISCQRSRTVKKGILLNLQIFYILWDTLEELFEREGVLMISQSKLRKHHIYMSDADKMKAGPAVRVLSKHVANTIERMDTITYFKNKPYALCKFLRNGSVIFGSMNSREILNVDGLEPESIAQVNDLIEFGKDLAEWKRTDEFVKQHDQSHHVSSHYVKKDGGKTLKRRESYLAYQTDYDMQHMVAAVVAFVADPGIPKAILALLTQDVLENLFGVVRNKNKNPTAQGVNVAFASRHEMIASTILSSQLAVPGNNTFVSTADRLDKTGPENNVPYASGRVARNAQSGDRTFTGYTLKRKRKPT